MTTMTHVGQDSIRAEFAQAQLLDIVRTLSDELHGVPPAQDGGKRNEARAPITPDTEFARDLGFDSLVRAELLTRVEQAFGTNLPVDAFASAKTPADVLDALTSPMRLATAGACAPAPAAQAVRAATSVDTPNVACTWSEVMQWHAIRYPERAHLVILDEAGGARRVSTGQLYRQALLAAGGLRALGVAPGDTIALMLPTSVDYFVCFCAILFCNAIPVPLYPPSHRLDLEDHMRRNVAILANARVNTLIAAGEIGLISRLLALQVPTLRRVLSPAQIAPQPMQAPLAARADDIALLQYTSGSTGTPKGVMLSHANLLANVRAIGERIRVDANDVLVSWLPLYHDMGLIGAWLAPLYFGLTLVVISPLTFLARPENWLHAIARYRGTITAAPNFAYERCVQRLARGDLTGVDLSSLRFAFCGAEPVNPRTIREFAARFAAYGLDPNAMTPVYGLAENTLGLTFPSPSRGLHVDRIVRAALDQSGNAVTALNGDDIVEVVGCGYPLDGTDLRIVDNDGREVPTRRIGRIEFRGSSATCGYWQNAPQTEALFDGDWLDTGDLGYIADGELFVTGRVKDMIIRGGRHYFPYELEDTIGRLPGVVHGGVAVCGARDELSGTEQVVIVAETTLSSDDADARSRLKARINAAAIALYGAPAEQLALVPRRSIVRTPGGKIRHAATLERFLQSGQVLAPPAFWRQVADTLRTSGVALVRRQADRARHAAHGVRCWSVFAAIAASVFVRIAFRHDKARNWRILAQGCRLFLRAAGLRVIVAGDLDGAREPHAVIVSNHTSYLDVLALVAALPAPVGFVSKRELAHHPFAGPLLRAIGARFVERGSYAGSLADEAQLIEFAKAGERLLFFPEGTFTREAGLRAFHLGAFRCACMSGYPVVPVALRGARTAMRDGEWVPRRGTISISVLPTIAPDGADFAATARLRERVRAAIVANCGEPDTAGPIASPAASRLPASTATHAL
ncbi:AMP-binding protein [Paraburkholderia rhizosphaerae]|uniref:1-acyl-sn-glycerol-3-phosphate acyltransferase n=1 Tax=Paraburkholderia rhizosphaerae TaxID=480658 RepID=A0A4R8LVZ0_9BURK|nr:AMP-binding protein [Paraburkholderia rhizosphaerae]TDY50957.1 1-acyl-sn-glycerol-3-phosphate acyltransferase [Paraburkholderia rhizosphaerae]